VVAIRDGTAIASVGVARGSNDLWLVTGAEGCEGYGLDLAF